VSASYFVTGAQGCIGAWVVKTLVERGDRPFVFDLSDDRRRLEDLLGSDALSKVRFAQGDITDYAALAAAVESSAASKIVHLAGLQVPFCKADPALGARVNVVGTIHMLQIAAEQELERVVYASSAAVYGPPEDAAAPDESAECEPTTHYGVFKRANEGNARIYYQDSGVSSVGLRPLTVYGVGRDQGLTSGPTRAMKAAAIGQEFQIPFGGATDFNYVGDTAATFVACADRAPEGAHVFNLHGESVEVARIVELIAANTLPEHAGKISFSGPELPIPPSLDGTAIHEVIGDLPDTALADGIARTMAHFRMLQDEGRLSLHDLA
jgi:nucleoside-diphosphate-sugar epimerase